MKAGDEVIIKARILRVQGTRVAAQTADGQLIQTERFNVETQQVELPEHKAILNAPENKSARKNKS